MHGANRLGGNSLSDLLVFGRRAGIGAADFAEGRTATPTVSAAEIQSVIDEAEAPFAREGGDNPYDIQHELQETMQSLVGIIRTGPELEEALVKLEEYKGRVAKLSVKGGKVYNPGWNLATDLPSMITTSIAVAQGALNRKESRGGHTREDYPLPDPELGKVNFVQRQTAEHGYLAPITVNPEPLPEMPAELRALLEEAH
jgi:succinate dehydrogenase / fumarate reductase flavoprotein subunit